MTQDPTTRQHTADLVGYVINRLSGKIGRTMILKLVYLIDLESRRYVGKPVSCLEYRLWNHGPFDAEIYRAIETLREAGDVAEETIHYPSASGYRYSTTNPARVHGLTRAEEAIVSYVLCTYASHDLQEVLDVVYNTKPMKAVEGSALNSRIPVESVDNEMRMKLGGVDLERALAAEENVQQGRSVPWSSLRRELLDRTRRTGS